MIDSGFDAVLPDIATAHRVVIALTHHARRGDGWRTGPLSPVAYAADRVLTLDRPAWFDPLLRREGGEVAKIHVVRNRSGRESSVSVWFRRETAKFDAPEEFEDCE